MNRFPVAMLIAGSLLATLPVAAAQDEPPATGLESITAPARLAGPGRLEGDVAAGFRFVPVAGRPIDLNAIERIEFQPPADPASAPARMPFQVRAGAADHFAGRLAGIDDSTVRLDNDRGHPLVFPRHAVREIIQAAGEAIVVDEGFETLDDARWSRTGTPSLGNDPVHQGQRSLRLPADGSSMSLQLAEPLAAGRFTIAYHDDGAQAADTRAVVSLTFRGPDGPEPMDAVLGWDSNLLAVRSRGAAPALAVQALERKRGWHVLDVTFSPRFTAFAIDGDELAYGDGPGGPLVTIRLATEPPATPGDAPSAVFDELRLLRRSGAAASLERDPTQDELRLASGDQLFGSLLSADAQTIRLRVLDREVKTPWKAATGLLCRRVDQPTTRLDGLWVRVAWGAPADGGEPPNRAQGVLQAADRESIRLLSPYLPELRIPRDQLRELVVEGSMGRVVLVASPHHLGNSYSPQLDPPQPEGRQLEIPFNLPRAPEGDARLAFDVVQLIGAGGDPAFSPMVQNGELVTNVYLNGDKLDQLNRHLDTLNDTPRRILMPLPPGRLKQGANLLRLELTGTKASPDTLDNFGLLGLTLEFPAKPAEAVKP